MDDMPRYRNLTVEHRGSRQECQNIHRFREGDVVDLKSRMRMIRMPNKCLGR